MKRDEVSPNGMICYIVTSGIAKSAESVEVGNIGIALRAKAAKRAEAKRIGIALRNVESKSND